MIGKVSLALLIVKKKILPSFPFLLWLFWLTIQLFVIILLTSKQNFPENKEKFMATANPFAHALDTAILAHEMLGKEAAKGIGVSAGAITRWRTGQEVPTDEKYLRAISQVLDLDFDQLCVDAFTSKFPFLKSMFENRPGPSVTESTPFSDEERSAILKVLKIMRHSKIVTKILFLDHLELFYKRHNQTSRGAWLKVQGYPSTYEGGRTPTKET